MYSRRNRWLGRTADVPGAYDGSSYINYWWCDTCPFLLGVSAWDENYYSIPAA